MVGSTEAAHGAATTAGPSASQMERLVRSGAFKRLTECFVLLDQEQHILQSFLVHRIRIRALTPSIHSPVR